VIERRPECLQISVSIPLPEQLVEDLNKQEISQIKKQIAALEKA
jgi:hypothetical protein